MKVVQRISLRCPATLVLCLVLGAPLAAHDMWIEPTAFVPEVGKIIGVKLRIGQDFLGDPLPRDPALIDQFVVIDSEGRSPIVGRDGADPAGLVRVGRPGLLIVGYRSLPSSVELPAATFNQYLNDEGLDGIVATRASRHQTDSAAREIFSRCAKSLVLSGSPRMSEGDRAIGFTLELVAKRNPYAVGVGQDLPIDLIYQGRPLPNALVIAMNRTDPGEKLRARTDGQGRVTFRLPKGGAWLIKAVHMVPAASGSHADWESFWASLTFELNPATNGD